MVFKKGNKYYCRNEKCTKCGAFKSKIRLHVCKEILNKCNTHPSYIKWYSKIKTYFGQDRIGKSPWNKGLTKYDSLSLMSISKIHTMKYKLGINNCGFKKGHINTLLQRKICSDIMKNGGAIKARMCVKHNRISNAELKFKNILDTLKINYNQQFAKGKYCFDFYVKNYNLIIEIDGNYWHSYPYYKNSDLIKNDFVVQKGYYLMRIWESEVYDETFVISNLVKVLNHIEEHEVNTNDIIKLPTLPCTIYGC